MKEQTIDGSPGTLTAAIANGDPSAVAACYAEAAQLLAPGAGLLNGRAEIERFWRSGIELGLASLDLEHLAGDRSGALAYQLGRYELRLAAPESAPIVETGHYLVVHRRQGEDWGRAVEFFAPDRPTERNHA
jgi:ketosteroid isomerase-like protein